MKLPLSLDDGVNSSNPFVPAASRRREKWLADRCSSMPPSMMTCATCNPCGRTRAIDCATLRNSALVAAKEGNGGDPRRLAVAPVRVAAPLPKWHGQPRHVTSTEKAAETSRPPGFFDLLNGQGAQFKGLIVRRFEDHDIGRIAVVHGIRALV